MRRTVSLSLIICLPVILAGCSGVFESSLDAPQPYVLRLPPAAPPTGEPGFGSLRVQRPQAGPGLHTDRIALLRSGGRFDFYAAARWAAPTPELLESVLVESLRATGRYSSVFDAASPFTPQYDLRVYLRRFEADYGAGGGPTVHVVMDCTLGRHRDRNLLASFTVQGSARAEADRLGAIVSAFEAATAAAVSNLLASAETAVASDRQAPEGAAGSEGR